MPSVAGRVNERLEPVVAVRLVGGPAGRTEVECVVDTGFLGAALVLPQEVIDELGLVVTGYEEVATVGGATVTADVTIGQVEWLGEVRSVSIIIIGESYLIGSHLLDGTRLTVDYAGRTVNIEQQPAPAG
jgi:clan AA aspartic protease